MKKFAIAAIGLLACLSVCRADVAQDVASASKSPDKIPEVVKALEKDAVPEFVSKLVKVLAAKPASPVVRVKGLVDASKLVFSTVSQDVFADAIVASTANVPFNALPEWTRLCKPTTKAISVKMSDTQYDSIVRKVIKDIADLASVPKENKAVVTICALHLLAREKTPEDEFAWLRKIEGIPEGYRQDVLDGYKAMANGDYSSLFGDTKIIKVDAEPEAAEPVAKADEKKPVADEKKPAAEEKKPAAEEKKPAVADEKKPAADEKKPAADEKKPAADEKKPAADEKTPPRLVDPAEGPNPPDPLVPGAQNLPDTKVGDGGTGATGSTIDPFGTDRPSVRPAVPTPQKPVVPKPYRGQF